MSVYNVIYSGASLSSPPHGHGSMGHDIPRPPNCGLWCLWFVMVFLVAAAVLLLAAAAVVRAAIVPAAVPSPPPVVLWSVVAVYAVSQYRRFARFSYVMVSSSGYFDYL